MYNEKTYELIDKFLDGTLSENEREEYNRLLANDENFEKEIDKVRKANEAIHQLGLFEISQRLDQIHQKKTTGRKRLLFSILGGILLVASGLIVSQFYHKSESEEISTPLQSESHTKNVITSTKKSIVVIEEKKESLYDSTRKDERVETLYKQPEQKEIEPVIPSQIIPIDVQVEPIEKVQETKKEIKKEEVLAANIKKEEKEGKKCPTITLNHYEALAACKGESNGKISILNSNISGGTTPYTIYIIDENRAEVLDATNLSEGEYIVKIIDAEDCGSTETKMTISEKRCVKQYSLRLSPTYGEKLVYPELTDVSEYLLIIRDQQNNVIYEKEVMQGIDSEWDGQLENGTNITPGIYILEIKNEDETLAVGTITII